MAESSDWARARDTTFLILPLSGRARTSVEPSMFRSRTLMQPVKFSRGVGASLWMAATCEVSWSTLRSLAPKEILSSQGPMEQRR